MSQSDAEIVLPFPAPLTRLETVTEIRSTLIASSLQSLKARGLLERLHGAVTETAPRDDLALHCGSVVPIDDRLRSSQDVLRLLEIPHFRTAAQGVYQVAIGMFAKRAHVRFVAARSRVARRADDAARFLAETRRVRRSDVPKIMPFGLRGGVPRARALRGVASIAACAKTAEITKKR